MIVCLALSPSVDVTYEVDGFRLGATSRPLAVRRVAGGKSLNVARALSRLGAPVEAVAILGGESGHWISSELQREGVRVHEVRCAAPTRTCISIVDVASAAPVSTDLYETARAVTAEEWAAFGAVVLAALAAASAAAASRPGWVAVSGSIPAGVDPDALGRLLATGRACGWKIAVDSHGEPLRRIIRAGVDLVKVNAEEAAELLASPPASVADAEAPAAAPAPAASLPAPDPTAADLAAAIVARFGVDAIVTDGVRGAAVHALDGRSRQLATARRGRYPAGSGDAFFAGMLSVLDADGSLADALPRAVAAGTANALEPGQAVFDPVIVAELEFPKLNAGRQL